MRQIIITSLLFMGVTSLSGQHRPQIIDSNNACVSEQGATYLKVNSSSDIEKVTDITSTIEIDVRAITPQIKELCQSRGIEILATGDDRVADYELMQQLEVDIVKISKPHIYEYVISGWPKPLIAPKEKVTLIAHRGGVVEGGFSENSINSLEAAIERGYKYVEVDIRKSKDGVILVQHDPTFKRFYGVDRRVSDMNWDEIKQLSAPDGSSPITFEQFCSICKDRIFLMLDIKPDDMTIEDLDEITATMRENNLVEGSLSFSYTEYFDNKMRISRNFQEIPAAFAQEGDISGRYFIFEGAGNLGKDIIKMANRRGVEVVVALNTWAYRGQDDMVAALNEALYFMSLGVTTFQIDSDYDRFFREYMK